MDLGEIGYELVTRGKDAAIQAIEEYVRSADQVAARAELAANKVEQATLREIKVYEAKLAAVERTKRQLETLEASMMRNGAAQLKYQRGIELITESRKLSLITDVQYEKLLDALGEQFRIATAEAEKNSAASRESADAKRHEANEVTRAAAAYQKLSAQLDPAEEKTRRHAQAIQVLAEARAKGIITEEEEIRKLALLGQSEDESIAKKEELAKAYDRVLMRFDPATRAMRNYTDSMVTLNRAEAAGVISKQELARAIEAVNEHMRKAGFVVNQWGVELSGNSAKHVRFLRGAVQQAGYQFGDFFIQIQGGINPVVAFGQQFAQLAGIFGATGAVVGASVAIFTALANMWMTSSGSGKNLDETVGELEKSFSTLNGTIDTLLEKDLTGKFGSLTAAMKEMTNESVNLDIAMGMENLMATLNTLESANIEQGWWQKFKSGAASLAFGSQFSYFTEGAKMSAEQLMDVKKQSDMAANFEKLGIGFGYDTFLGYQKGILDAVENGTLDEVSRRIAEMYSDAISGSDFKTLVEGGGYEFLKTFADMARMAAESQAKLEQLAAAARKLQHEQKIAAALIAQGSMGRNPEFGMNNQNFTLPDRASSRPKARPTDIDFGDEYRAQELAKLQHQYEVYYNSRVNGEAELADASRRYADAMLAIQSGHYAVLKEEHDAYVRAITNGYQVYAASRMESNEAIADAQRQIDANNEAAELRRLEMEYGRESLAYQTAAFNFELDRYQAMVNALPIAESLKQEMVDSYVAANAITNLNLAGGIAIAAGAAKGLSDWLWSSLAAAAAIARAAPDATRGPSFEEGGRMGSSSAPYITPPKTLDDYITEESAGSGGSPGGGGGKAKEDALEKLRKQIRLERELVGISEAEQRVLKALGEDRKKYSEEEIAQVIAEIEAHEKKMEAIEEEQNLWDHAGDAMNSFFMDSIKGTKTVEQAFKDMAYNIIEQLYEVLVVQRMVGSFNVSTGVGSGLMGMLGNLLMADGGVFVGGQHVTAFAQGGIVNSPTYFGMRGGVGLMGEAGPEAIMPLKRGSDGKLGVSVSPAATGGGTGGNTSVTLNFNITGSDSVNVKREIINLIPQIEKRVIQGVVSTKKRGGAMAREF